MSKRWVAGIAGLVLIVVAAGGFYVIRGRRAAPVTRAVDPGLAVAVAVRVLERNPTTRLSPEQVAKVLPLLKALKDVPPTDAEAAAAIARAVRDTFTPAQVAALEEARERLPSGPRRGAAAGGRPANPGTADQGQGSGFDQRAQIRARIFDGVIRLLEQRLR